MLTQTMDLHGQAMMDYLQGEKDAYCILRRDDGVAYPNIWANEPCGSNTKDKRRSGSNGCISIRSRSKNTFGSPDTSCAAWRQMANGI